MMIITRCFFVLLQKNDAHGMEVDVTVEDLVKLIEDLSRIH